MADPLPVPDWMRACALPQAWRGHPAWRVLDADFGQGGRFFPLWQAWADDPHGCAMLHIVAITDKAPSRDAMLGAMAAFPSLSAIAPELAQQWFGLLPGFHHLVLHQGRLRLTLCIGTRQAMLREQQFVADSIVLQAADNTGQTSVWDAWGIKALTRLCRRGTGIALPSQGRLDPAMLEHAGFVAQPSSDACHLPQGVWSGCFQPRWQIKSSRNAWQLTPIPVADCIVIGAGLAGASAAGALAARGWTVTVLDAAPTPAAGASALPVGLLAPQVSRDDGPRSHLSRVGVRMTLQAARRLLRHGQDWALSGTAWRGEAAAALPAPWPPQGRAWVEAGLPPGRALPGPGAQAGQDDCLWHAAAGWIKPAALIHAWFAQPGVRFQGNSPVHGITRGNGQWRLFGSNGHLLAEATQLVIACAGHTDALVHMAMEATATATARAIGAPSPRPPAHNLASLAAVHGQVSWAAHTDADQPLFPDFPVNGAGSVLAQVPWQSGTAWFAGATYENATAPALTESQAHAQNLERIAQLLPGAAAALQPAFASGGVHAWRGTRWTTSDRLPIVGHWPLDNTDAMPSLWISTAMGSRGLTYATLCGELIAVQMGAEPLPLEARLLRFISSGRARVRL